MSLVKGTLKYEQNFDISQLMSNLLMKRAFSEILLHIRIGGGSVY